MTHGPARLGLAATAAVALIAVASIVPASAETKIYSPLTDCSKLVGNDKADCDHQAKNSTSPDNANNPDNSSINTSNPPVYETLGTATSSAPTTTTAPANLDCSKLVGNLKTDCESQPKN